MTDPTDKRDIFTPADAEIPLPPAPVAGPITNVDIDNAVAAFNAADPEGLAGILTAEVID